MVVIFPLGVWLFTAVFLEGAAHPWLCGAPLLHLLCYISRTELSVLVGSLTVKQTTRASNSSVSIAVSKMFKERHFCDSE